MGSRLMDPGAGARETAANRAAADQGMGVRFCYHPDCTLTSVTVEEVRMVRTECDYCPAFAMTVAGRGARELPPWAYRVTDDYPSIGPRPVTRR